MRMFQNHGEPLMALLYVQLLLVIESDCALAKRRPQAQSSTAKLSRARGMQVARLLANEKLQPSENGATPRSLTTKREKPRLQVVSRSTLGETPRSETSMYARLAGSERPARRLVVVQQELGSGSAKVDLAHDANNKQRLKDGEPHGSANAKNQLKEDKKNGSQSSVHAGQPHIERQSRSLSTNHRRGEHSHRRGMEHLPNALESLRRLGTDLNILGNELMGFHFPSYLRVLMYVVSLIL